jgi:nucleotide-binding universal stress UspA family protein
MPPTSPPPEAVEENRMRHILVPIDASQPARMRSAIDEVVRLHREEPVRVRLLSVQPKVSGHVAMFFDPQELHALQIDAGTEDLQPAQRLLDAAGVPYTCEVRIGRSADTIVATAYDLRCSGIVFGGGSGGAAGWLFGSLAQQVRMLLGGHAELQVIGP